MEENTKCLDDFANFIYQYNVVKASMILRFDNRYLRSQGVFFNLNLRRKREYEWKWIVNEKEMIFSYDVKKKAFYFD